MTKERQESEHIDGNNDREVEVTMLMQEIDAKINRFVELTGASGKKVKRRWRDIKKSAGR